MAEAAHEIVTKAPCRLGRVQIEDWHKVYPGLGKPYTVALYATLQATPSYRPTFLMGGESARFSFNFATLAEARDVYLALREGADPHDYLSAFTPNNPQWTDEDSRLCIPH